MNQKIFSLSGQYLIDEIKKRAEKQHSHFFDVDTMKFFSSQISNLCWSKGSDIYFITSEKDTGRVKHAGSIRAFTVRKCSENGYIVTIGKFQEHETLAQARTAIQEVLKN